MALSVRQLWFRFFDLDKKPAPAPAPAMAPNVSPVSVARHEARAGSLEEEARGWLRHLGFTEGAEKLTVTWKPRMRSSAGYAKWPHWCVELNPRLKEFPGEVTRTLKHELAHLVAHARAGRRRIAPHGREWRQACSDLGIPGESARHTLPLPSRRQKRNYSYACPSCGVTVDRVRKFRRRTACLACCRTHNRGHYDARFEFILKAGPRKS
jgi:predicted SprT family Zn-dependent metalloprotease